LTRLRQGEEAAKAKIQQCDVQLAHNASHMRRLDQELQANQTAFEQVSTRLDQLNEQLRLTQNHAYRQDQNLIRQIEQAMQHQNALFEAQTALAFLDIDAQAHNTVAEKLKTAHDNLQQLVRIQQNAAETELERAENNLRYQTAKLQYLESTKNGIENSLYESEKKRDSEKAKHDELDLEAQKLNKIDTRKETTAIVNQTTKHQVYRESNREIKTEDDDRLHLTAINTASKETKASGQNRRRRGGKQATLDRLRQPSQEGKYLLDRIHAAKEKKLNDQALNEIQDAPSIESCAWSPNLFAKNANKADKTNTDIQDSFSDLAESLFVPT
jgi:hypothetical protein